ncbi:hypothetical protein C1646_776673 [Rhizophagus diaphanus]|nr:hypothetical protein C1646_776673 [Rhizophagus diaphanus] [Rhizophagus sp. MUCL 43196]
MPELNKDVIFLILKELQDDVKSLYPYLLINKTWCETTVPILWKNPVNRYYEIDKVNNNLFNVIISHISEESKENLKNQGIEIFTKTYKRPSFNYISYWRHLDLLFLQLMMDFFLIYKNIEKFKISIIENEIFNLFNKNTKFNFLNLINSQRFNTFHISGTENCFSELETFHCNDFINCNILKRLAIINTSIKELKFEIENNIDKSGIVRLIEVQKNLKNVYLILNYTYIIDESYHTTIENSLIKCANTVQYLRIDWKPYTKFLSYLVNLVSLEIKAPHDVHDVNWSHLDEIFLPLLKILKAHSIPSRILTNLIKNTKARLIEISIFYQGIDDGKLIKAICQSCPNLSYFRLSMYNNDISKFENLLINCLSLNRLEITGMNVFNEFNWDMLFIILAKFSPIGLFNFKFSSYRSKFKLSSLKLFLDNWKNRYPMLLQIISAEHISKDHQRRKDLRKKLENLVQIYKANGIVEKYNIDGDDFEDFK